MNKALLLIDIQNDYFTEGRMPLVNMESAVTNAKIVLEHFRVKNFPIYHIQHISTRPDATFFLPGTEGAAIHVEVKPLPSEQVIQKNYPNSFRNTPLLDELKTNVT